MTPRPDTLAQTAQAKSHMPLADGAGHTFFLPPRSSLSARELTRAVASGPVVMLFAGQINDGKGDGIRSRRYEDLTDQGMLRNTISEP